MYLNTKFSDKVFFVNIIFFVILLIFKYLSSMILILHKINNSFMNYNCVSCLEPYQDIVFCVNSAPLVSTPVWARDFNSSEEFITEFCRECRIVRKGTLVYFGINNLFDQKTTYIFKTSWISLINKWGIREKEDVATSYSFDTMFEKKGIKYCIDAILLLQF